LPGQLAQSEDTRKIRLKDRVPILPRMVRCRSTTDCPSIVHEDVDPAEAGNDLIDDLTANVRIAQIAGYSAGFPAGLVDTFCGFCRYRLRSVQRDLRASLGQCQRDSETEPARRARDQCLFPTQIKDIHYQKYLVFPTNQRRTKLAFGRRSGDFWSRTDSLPGLFFRSFTRYSIGPRQNSVNSTHPCLLTRRNPSTSLSYSSSYTKHWLASKQGGIFTSTGDCMEDILNIQDFRKTE